MRFFIPLFSLILTGCFEKRKIDNAIKNCHSLKELSEKFPKEVKKIQILPSTTVKLTPPISIGDKYAAYSDKPKSISTKVFSNMYAYELSNVRLYRRTEKTAGDCDDKSFVVNLDGKFSTSFSAFEKSSQQKRIFTRKFRNSGNKVYKIKYGIMPGLWHAWCNNYHFLYHYMSFIVLTNDIVPKKFQFINCVFPNQSFSDLHNSFLQQRKTINLKNIMKSQKDPSIVAVDFEKLITTQNYMLNRPDTFRLIRKLVLDKYKIVPEKKIRLYISRWDSGKRRIKNEKELMDCLEKYGFKKIMLTGMTLKQQAELFSKAGIVIGGHGAGFANLAFCPKNIDVIELLYPLGKIPHGCMWMLCNTVGLKYYYLTGEINEEDKNIPIPQNIKDYDDKIHGNLWLSDFSVDVKKIDDWLQKNGYKKETVEIESQK